jgi:tripartite ATP-independent transporter DctP family solute receptor
MKRFVISVFVLLLAASLFAGAVNEKKEKIILRWGTVHADSTITTQMMRRIIDEVNSKAKGVEIQGFNNGVLGSSRDLVEGVQTGMVDIIIEGPGFFSSKIPVSTIVDAPYIYRDAEHMSKVLNGQFGQQLNEQFLKNNVRILGAFYYGTRQLTMSKAEVHSVKDMQGLKIRVPENKAYMEMIASWGARATPMPLGDLYLALQTNVVDGQENPLPTIDGQKFYEVQKYIILTSHIVAPNFIFINEPAFQKVSPEDQAIIQTAMKNGIAWNDAEVLKSEETLRKDLVTKGVTFITPDLESFRTVTGPWLISKFETDWGKGTWESIQAVK